MVFAMMVPNMIGLVLLAPKVKKELKKYMEVIKADKA
jgi:AGCS family alanine or glycine:cation symporter